MPRSRRSRINSGYFLAVLGAGAFVAGCFLPFFRFNDATNTSFYDALVTRGSPVLAGITAAIFLCSGAATVALISILGAATRSQIWAPIALPSAAATWALTWLGLIFSQRALDVSLDFGYLVMLSGIGVVVLGTIVVLFSSRAERSAAPSSPIGP